MKCEPVQVATLITVIGRSKEASEMFVTFDWTQADDEAKIEPVLTKFSNYGQSQRKIPFERLFVSTNALKSLVRPMNSIRRLNIN